MESPVRLKELGQEVQAAIDRYAELDSVENYKILQKRVRQLERASSQPSDTLFSFRCQAVENIAIMMLLEGNVLGELAKGGRQSMSAAELAAKTGFNDVLVARLMRVATGLLFAEESGENAYRANLLTEMISNPGWRGAFNWGEIVYPVAAEARRFVNESGYCQSGEQGAPSAYEFVAGRSIWKVLDEQAEVRKSFDLWMRERRKHEETSWHKRFPQCLQLSRENLKGGKDAVLMVDVGGATGSQIINFRQQFPDLPGRCILQDLQPPKTDGGSLDGVEVSIYDFFAPQPVKGARYYYFRNVFHNWSDEKAAEILRNVVLAMDPEYSTVLIDDFVLPTVDCQLRGAVEDILMMISLNGLERTRRQYEDLLASVGLEMVHISSVGANEEAIIEARIKR